MRTSRNGRRIGRSSPAHGVEPSRKPSLAAGSKPLVFQGMRYPATRSRTNPVAREGFELVQQSPRKQAITTERDAEYDPRCAELGAVDADLQQLITLAPAVGGQPARSTPSAGFTITHQRPLEGPLRAPDLEVLHTPIGVCRRQEFAHAPPGCNKYPWLSAK